MNPNDPMFPAPELAIAKGVDKKTILQLGATQGMTKREYFAALAMQGYRASGARGIDTRLRFLESHELAELALRDADALIEALNKNEISDGKK